MQPISTSTPLTPIPPYLEGEFFRRISDASKQQIASATAELFPTTQQIAELKSRDYSQLVFKETNWLYLAIKAYANGQLEEHILAHLFLYDTCSRNPLFQYFTPFSRFIPWSQFLKGSFAESWMDAAIDEVVNSNLPMEDRQVFVYCLNCNSHPHEPFLLHQLQSYPRTFMPVVKPWRGSRLYQYDEIVIIPPKLFAALLNAYFKETAITPLPVLGYSPKEKFSNTTQRVMSIQHPELAVIDSHIHNHFHAKESSLPYFHDMYHLIIESANPYRKIFVEIFHYLQTLAKEEAALKTSPCFKWYTFVALDRDFPGLVLDRISKTPILFKDYLTVFLDSYENHLTTPLIPEEETTMNRLKRLIRNKASQLYPD
ncbi:MAG: hypothetical protein RLZZ453_693 [Chlamydiota bacterium]|jgi:hypothetical protein